MTVIYLRSTDGNDSDNGSTWALAKATLAAALTAAGAGGTIYRSKSHAESQASAMTLTSPGTAASPVLILTVDDTGNPQPPTALATGASVTTSVGAISFAGYAYDYGCTFNSGTSSSPNINFTATSAWGWTFENGELSSRAASGGSGIVVGQSSGVSVDQKLLLINSNLRFAATTSVGLNLGGNFEWRGGSLLGTCPSSVFTTTSFSAKARICGVDLSLAASGSSLVTFGSKYSDYLLVDCKLGSSVSVTSGSPSGPGMVVSLVNCDSADTHYRYYFQDYRGTITQETTIVRTGGATDGATAFSRKFVSTANTKFNSPLEGPWFYFWNETIGSVTVPIEVVTDNVTGTDADWYVEVEGLTTSGFPIGSLPNDRAADILATPVNQTTSTETWTTTGLGTPVKQVCSKAVTIAEAGWVRARLCVIKASATLYACPKILSTSQYQYMDQDGNVLNGPAAGGAAGILVHGGMQGGLRG